MRISRILLLVFTMLLSVEASAFESRSTKLVAALEKLDFADAQRIALECRNDDGEKSVRRRLQCGEVYAGILRAQGNAFDWARAMRWLDAYAKSVDLSDMQQTMLPIAKDLQSAGIILDESLRSISNVNAEEELLYEARANSGPVTSSDETISSYDLSAFYTVEIDVSGVRKAAIVDTGSSDFIYMSARSADRLGITHTLASTDPKTELFTGKTSPVSDEYRSARNIAIGRSKFTNVLVRVDMSNSTPWIVLGIGYLANFRTIRFSNRGLSVNAARPQSLFHTSQLKFQSDLYLSNPGLITQIDVFDRQEKALLDTGHPGWVAVLNPMASEITSRYGLAGRHLPRTTAGTPFTRANIVVSGVALAVDQTLLYDKSPRSSKYSTVLGRGFKSKADIFLDFRNLQFCVTPPQTEEANFK